MRLLLAIEAAARAASATNAAVAQHRTFDLRVFGIGAFPNFGRARTVWMGVDGDPRWPACPIRCRATEPARRPMRRAACTSRHRNW